MSCPGLFLEQWLSTFFRPNKLEVLATDYLSGCWVETYGTYPSFSKSGDTLVSRMASVRLKKRTPYHGIAPRDQISFHKQPYLGSWCTELNKNTADGGGGELNPKDTSWPATSDDLSCPSKQSHRRRRRSQVRERDSRLAQQRHGTTSHCRNKTR